MARRANATSFKPGRSGNPAGRPPGIVEKSPRNTVGAAFDEVLRSSPELMTDAIRRGLQGRNALGYLELWARIGKEVGSGADTGVPSIFVLPGLDIDAFGAPSHGAGR